MIQKNVILTVSLFLAETEARNVCHLETKQNYQT